MHEHYEAILTGGGCHALRFEGKATVECSADKMTVVLSRASMPGIDERHLTLTDSSCSLTGNNTHIMGSMSFSTCGTKLVVGGVQGFIFPHTKKKSRRPNLIDLRGDWRVFDVNEEHIEYPACVFTLGLFTSLLSPLSVVK